MAAQPPQFGLPHSHEIHTEASPILVVTLLISLLWGQPEQAMLVWGLNNALLWAPPQNRTLAPSSPSVAPPAPGLSRLQAVSVLNDRGCQSACGDVLSRFIPTLQAQQTQLGIFSTRQRGNKSLLPPFPLFHHSGISPRHRSSRITEICIYSEGKKIQTSKGPRAPKASACP